MQGVRGRSPSASEEAGQGEGPASSERGGGRPVVGELEAAAVKRRPRGWRYWSAGPLIAAEKSCGDELMFVTSIAMS